MAMQPERRIVQSIQAYLEGLGARCFKIHGGDNPFQEAGIPDLLACYKGRFVGLEVKQPGGKPSKKQLKVLREIEAAGGTGVVVSTVEEVARLMRKLDRMR